MNQSTKEAEMFDKKAFEKRAAGIAGDDDELWLETWNVIGASELP